jgi:hypothetical protein
VPGRALELRAELGDRRSGSIAAEDRDFGRVRRRADGAHERDTDNGRSEW